MIKPDAVIRRASLGFCAVLVGLFAGTPAARDRNGFHDKLGDQDSIAKAVFEYELARASLSGESPPPVACLEVLGHDPSANLLESMARDGELLKRSSCSADRNGSYVNVDRRAANLISIVGLKRADDRSAEAKLQTYRNGLDASEKTMTLKLINGTWTVEQSREEWVS